VTEMQLYGREIECGRLAALVAAAAAGHGGALVVRGPPGVGKSALLEQAAAGAAGSVVLRAHGVEAELPLPFAALHRLLRPLSGHLSQLPAVQADALCVAFGEREGNIPDRFTVFVAALSLFAEAAEDRPVLVVVDDAQWLDPASAEALLFIARRLESDRIAAMFGARDEDVLRFEAPGISAVTLDPLDVASATDLLTASIGYAPESTVMEALIKATGGNPLGLIELPSLLTARQLAGEARLPDILPVTGAVERTFLDRYRRCSADARTLLLLAAGDDSGRIATLVSAGARLGLGDGILAEVEATRLLLLVGSEFRFRHPLVRSAIYDAAATAERQTAHRALAFALETLGDPDHVAWQLAAAASGPDEQVARRLDDVAQRCVHRGGHQGASAAWERAADLTSGVEPRAQRLFAAATSAWVAGRPQRSRHLAHAARDWTTDPVLSADIDRLRGRIEWSVGSAPTGYRIVMAGARDVASIDPLRAREMAMLATALATYGGAGVEGAVADIPLPPVRAEAPARILCLDALLSGQQHLLRGRLREAAVDLRRSFALVQEAADDVDLLVNTGLAALQVGDYKVAERDFSRLLRTGRTHGSVALTLVALCRLPIAELAVGHWNAANASLEEALTLADATAQPTLSVLPLAWRALLAALRGRDATPGLDELETLTAAHPVGIGGVTVADCAAWTRGLIAADDPATAFHHLSTLSLPSMQRLSAIDRLEAAARAGELTSLALWAEELEQFAQDTGAFWAAAAAAHGRALISDAPTADSWFLEALRLHDQAPRPFPRARTQLAYGEHLRRAGRRVDARPVLRACLEVFDDLGAAGWAQRAREALRASGETSRRREPSAALQLTPQEQQIVELVSGGLSNRDVAGRLFVSPRTVEYHLSHAYQKLGVRSRSQLVRMNLTSEPTGPA
jgi:DNA-binding CsgD family transcriptional regulator